MMLCKEEQEQEQEYDQEYDQEQEQGDYYYRNNNASSSNSTTNMNHNYDKVDIPIGMDPIDARIAIKILWEADQTYRSVLHDLTNYEQTSQTKTIYNSKLDKDEEDYETETETEIETDVNKEGAASASASSLSRKRIIRQGDYDNKMDVIRYPLNCF
ncbi:hypothetical protein FRACYDRAFT_235268 [Fragilariopsis cylindrus CCMP1102]|uniref:Uncharacterized protein n=1 Tax=Fragilariopsis cylindrus CCMP1102 TaxID=635003 RepID=A0A1E7FM23_9STRA|nr:hypothetical protein FRACYDRAFT_235268 [Fragilariopsis cylindrus CCMP1102]|eukprot:OEU19222.1 hypothetical protein FRACYDRAFT_235268 [Fragilariopsis cylindrus CCMP1102]